MRFVITQWIFWVTNRNTAIALPSIQHNSSVSHGQNSLGRCSVRVGFFLDTTYPNMAVQHVPDVHRPQYEAITHIHLVPTLRVTGVLLPRLQGKVSACLHVWLSTNLWVHSNWTVSLFCMSRRSSFCEHAYFWPSVVKIRTEGHNISKNLITCLSYSYNKSQQDALFLKLILVKNSRCIVQTYCPLLGVLILYTQQLALWYWNIKHGYNH